MIDQAEKLRELFNDGVKVEHAPSATRAESGDGHGASVRTGRVSFAPATESPEEPVEPTRTRLAQAVAITSGKGGVGKSNLTVNLAVALARSGRRVCVLDADFGLANVDVLCGLSPRQTLEHVITGKCRLLEATVRCPGGFFLVPGASGVADLADLDGLQRRRLLEQLADLERRVDVLLIDTGAGIGSNVMAFAAAAHRVLVAVTPEPTSMTDAYGAIKTLVGRVPGTRPELVINMATSRTEASKVYKRLDKVSRAFLETPLELAGVVPFDMTVRGAVRRRRPLTLVAPQAPASQAISNLAQRLMQTWQTGSAAPTGAGFLKRLAKWISSRQDEEVQA
ncbi:MAG: ATP-binding protein [Phycisphaerae bacterium]|nr:ATP-binding protein [Phycisphaerae bacterium]